MNISRFVPALLAFALPLAVSAASVNLVNIQPGTNVGVANMFSLTVVPSGLSSATYSVQDSFANSTAKSTNIEPGGKFSWVPSNSDVGTHTFTFTAFGSEGSATASQTITVLPPPTLTLTAPQPGTSVPPGTTLTFNAVASGFTNPTFGVGDMSTNPSIQPSNIDSSGRFSWTPTLSDNGEHTITVYVSDSLGHNASKSITVYVGKGPSLTVILLKPGASVKPGEAVTFTAAPNDFQPTGYSVWDSFKGSSASSNNMNLSGQFAWVPSTSDIGVHTLTITGVVGAFGKSASTSQTITVLNADGTMPAGVATAPIPTATTGTTDTSTLDALKAKLAALQGAIATQSGSTSGGSASSCSIVSYLKSGSSGDEVLCLQKLLAQLGYLSATPNGNFGPATMAAVKAFQKARGLEVLGVVGPGTRAALNGTGVPATPVATTSVGGTRYVFEHFMGIGDDDAQEVTELQKRLMELGYLAGPATGYYGPATETAVKAYQKARGIPETGYVASITRAALNK